MEIPISMNAYNSIDLLLNNFPPRLNLSSSQNDEAKVLLTADKNDPKNKFLNFSLSLSEKSLTQ